MELNIYGNLDLHGIQNIEQKLLYHYLEIESHRSRIDARKIYHNGSMQNERDVYYGGKPKIRSKKGDNRETMDSKDFSLQKIVSELKTYESSIEPSIQNPHFRTLSKLKRIGLSNDDICCLRMIRGFNFFEKALEAYSYLNSYYNPSGRSGQEFLNNVFSDLYKWAYYEPIMVIPYVKEFANRFQASWPNVYKQYSIEEAVNIDRILSNGILPLDILLKDELYNIRLNKGIVYIIDKKAEKVFEKKNITPKQIMEFHRHEGIKYVPTTNKSVIYVTSRKTKIPKKITPLDFTFHRSFGAMPSR